MRHVDLGVYCCQCVRVRPDSTLGKVWGYIVAVFVSIQHWGLWKMLEVPSHGEKCICADQDIYYLGSRNHFCSRHLFWSVALALLWSKNAVFLINQQLFSGAQRQQNPIGSAKKFLQK